MVLPLAASLTRRHVICAVAAIALWASGGPAWARDGDDHERARQAVQAGQVLPLRTVLASPRPSSVCHTHTRTFNLTSKYQN